MIVDQRVYRTAAGELTLDPEAAAFLAAAPGDELDDDQAAALGLGEAKAAEPAPNKSRRPASNKGA